MNLFQFIQTFVRFFAILFLSLSLSLSLSLCLSRAFVTMSSFLGGYSRNLDVVAQRQNLVVTTATVVIVVRILVPMAGRFAWHLWNKAIGEIKKDEDAPEVAIPEDFAEIFPRAAAAATTATAVAAAAVGTRDVDRLQSAKLWFWESSSMLSSMQ